MLRLVVQHHGRVIAIRRDINDSFGQYPNEFISRRYDYLFLHSDNKGSILKINKRILKGYFYKTTTSLYEMVVSCDFLFDDQSLITRISLSSIIICLCPLRTPLPFAWILRFDIKLTAITIVNRC